MIQNSLLQTVREECGLGSPPDPFMTYASETASSILKDKVDYKRSELPDFLWKLNELVHEQERDKYELCPHYQSWHVPEMRWFAMTTVQGEQHLKVHQSQMVLYLIVLLEA